MKIMVEMMQEFQVNLFHPISKKGPQLNQPMSQHTMAKYDYCTSEVRALPSLVLNIKGWIKPVQINKALYIEQGVVSAKSASLVAELALGALVSAFTKWILQWSNLASTEKSIMKQDFCSMRLLYHSLSAVYFADNQCGFSD